MKPTIKLVGGPYNGRVIEDRGTPQIEMSLSTDGANVGAKIGSAFYEPNAERTHAFYLDNKWLGTLEDVIPVD